MIKSESTTSIYPRDGKISNIKWIMEFIMIKKLLLTSLVVFSLNDLQAAADDLSVIFFCPGTPPRSASPYRHEPEAMGSASWEADMDRRLGHIEDFADAWMQQQQNDDALQEAIMGAYIAWFQIVESDLALLKDFLKKTEGRDQLTQKEIETAGSYLNAITIHFRELAEIAWNGVNPDVMPFSQEQIEYLESECLDNKGYLEDLIAFHNALPEDYDNGLI